MKSHRETCINRLTELAEEPALRPHVLRALCVGSETHLLSLAVQYVLEERDKLVDNQDVKQAGSQSAGFEELY